MDNEVYAAPPVSKKNSIVSMVLGICSICFSEVFGIPGIVLAILSKVYTKKYLEETGGVHNGFSKAGKATSTAGLIISIFFLIFWIVFSVGMGWLLGEVFNHHGIHVYF